MYLILTSERVICNVRRYDKNITFHCPLGQNFQLIILPRTRVFRKLISRLVKEEARREEKENRDHVIRA